MTGSYAHLADYADTGTAEYVGPDGFKHAVRFSTRFSRTDGLHFEFRPQHHEASSESEEKDRTGAGTLTANSRESRVFVEGDTGTEAAPIEVGTGQLQGVTLGTSIFVPRMVYGVPFCACGLESLSVRADGEEVIDHHKTIRLLVSSEPRKAVALWIDHESYLLRQVRITRTDADGAVHQTTIRYNVGRAL